MIIYHSGAHTELHGTPEMVLNPCHVMTTFHDIWKAKSDELPLRFKWLFRNHYMIIYYSGEGSRSNPEILLGDEANLMLTFHNFQKKTDNRWKKIEKQRRKPPKPGRILQQWHEVFELDLKMDDVKVGRVDSHFLDSGAFTLWTQCGEFAQQHKCHPLNFYDSDEFWQYMEGYVAFCKKWEHAIDYCANIDVIPMRDTKRWKKRGKKYEKKGDHFADKYARMTLRNQEWLEARGLDPVPVVHYTTRHEWLKYYIDQGYDFIGLGGLVGSSSQKACKDWIDRCFDIVCEPPSMLPKVKLHGFGVTSFELLLRYPWFSVDSTSWTKKGAYGYVFIPASRKGRWLYDRQPHTVTVSVESMPRGNAPLPYWKMSRGEQNLVQQWLQEQGIKFGTYRRKKSGKLVIKSYGVATRHTERRAANLLFFEELRKNLPQYPWPFEARRKHQGFAELL